MKYKLTILQIFFVISLLVLDVQSIRNRVRKINRNGTVRGIIPPASCTVTIEQLEELLVTINSFSTKRTEIRYPTPRKYADDPATCEELIDQMNDGILELSNLYQQLLDSSIPPSEYEAMKQEYEDKIKELNKQFDDLAQAAKEESQREIEQLENALQDLQVKLDNAIDALEEERAAHRETKTLLVIANIQANQISAALQTYHELQETALMTRIITDAYLNINTYSNCQGFTEQTKDYEAWSLGYAALYTAMERKGDIQTQETIEFAYIIKEILDSYYGEYRNRFDDLKSRFSVSVQYIIWSYTVCMRNTEYNEYIYSPNDYFDYDGDRARVFTWVPGNQVIESPLQFQPQGRGEYFFLKSTYRNRYMYSPNDYFNYDSDRREVFFWKSGSPVSNGDWIVKIDSYDTIRLYSRTNRQYLYAASSGFNYDSDRRRLFTWIPGNNVQQAAFQLLQC